MIDYPSLYLHPAPKETLTMQIQVWEGANSVIISHWVLHISYAKLMDESDFGWRVNVSQTAQDAISIQICGWQHLL